MKRIRIADFINSEDKFFTLPFDLNRDGHSGDALKTQNPEGRSGGSISENLNLCMKSDKARWGMTLCKAGSMRFRWNETNPNRENNFSSTTMRKANAAVIETYVAAVSSTF